MRMRQLLESRMVGDNKTDQEMYGILRNALSSQPFAIELYINFDYTVCIVVNAKCKVSSHLFANKEEKEGHHP